MKRLFATLIAVLFAAPLFAATLGDDGLHKTDWMRETFKDLGEDLAEANAEGKRLMVIIEQRGVSIAKRCTRKFLSCLRSINTFMTTTLLCK